MRKILSPLRLRDSDKYTENRRAKDEDARETAISGLRLTLDVLKDTADAIPPPAGPVIKGVLGGFLQVVDIVKVVGAIPIGGNIF
jgi:hypothetical protein